MINHEEMSGEFEELFRYQAKKAAEVRQLTAKAGEIAVNGEAVPEELINVLNEAKFGLKIADNALVELKAKYIKKIEALRFF